MKIAVVGAGGVGGYFGGRLAQAGQEVVFIARGEHLRVMRDSGLRVDSIEGDFVLKPVNVTDDADAVGSVDVVLVAVKAWQVAAAAETLRPLVDESTVLLPLLNGVEAPDQLAEMFGRQRVLGGLCSLVSMLAAPGHIRHIGAHPSIQFGELEGPRSERVGRLHAAFCRAKGLRAEVPADVRVAMWRKFLLIAPWSGVGAITRAPVGVLRTVPETRALVEQAMEEVFAVGRRLGVSLPPDAIPAALGFIDALPPDSTASMQRDVMAGRPSEIEAQNGAVVRLGREAGVATPVNGFLYAGLLPMEMQARGKKD